MAIDGEDGCDAAEGIEDSATLLDVRMAVLEAKVTSRKPAPALSVFHDIEPALKTHSESRWRALAMMAKLDRRYFLPASDAIREFAAQLGNASFRQYLTREDVGKLSWPVLNTNSAKH